MYLSKVLPDLGVYHLGHNHHSLDILQTVHSGTLCDISQIMLLP